MLIAPLPGRKQDSALAEEDEGRGFMALMMETQGTG